MQTYISGQSGRAAVPVGARIRVFDINLENEIDYPISSLGLLFEGCSDLIKLELNNEKAILDRLHVEFGKDRALMLSLMLLDVNEDADICRESAVLLSQFLEKDQVRNFVKNRLFAYPMTEGGNLQKAISLAVPGSDAALLFGETLLNQKSISTCRSSWIKLAPNFFKERSDEQLYERALINEGVFTRAATAISDNDMQAMNNLKLDVLTCQKLSAFRGHREFIKAWLNPLTPNRNSQQNNTQLLKLLNQEDSNFEKESAHENEQISDHVAFQRAKSQIAKIVQFLNESKITQARKFAHELKSAQLKNDDPEFAAKSLCNIAINAMEMHHKSFALEMNALAVETAPNDGWAWAALADVQITLGNYNDAQQSLEKAKAFGEQLFAENAYMRLLCAQGKLHEAIEGYKGILSKHHDNPHVWTAFLGISTVYSDLKLFDEASRSLQQAIKLNPNEPELLRALASNYLAVGNMAEAEDTYRQACAFKKSEINPHIQVSARAGLGTVYIESGRSLEALKVFRGLKAEFPKEIISYKELARALYLTENTNEALTLYQEMKGAFPYDYSPYLERAQIFADQNAAKNAAKEISEAENSGLFEIDIGFKVRCAKLLKSFGATEEALQMFSKIRMEAPYNLSAKLGQADMLKELGRHDDALNFYKEISDIRSIQVVNTSIAAIYVTIGKYEDALMLLPELEPRTKSDWVNHHIRGMLLYKIGKTDKAIQIFEEGVTKMPFAKQKYFFTSALAIARLHDARYAEAVHALSDSTDVVSNVIKMSAYFGMGDIENANRAYAATQGCSQSNVVQLRREFSARLNTKNNVTSHDHKWEVEQCCDALTIAVSLQLAA